MKKLLPIILSFCLLACSKYEIEQIDGNEAPGENLVTTALKETYVNRIYLTLLGRKATANEFSEALEQLGSDAPQHLRHGLIDSLSSFPGYNRQLYAVARADYLESVDTAVIHRDYQQAVTALQNASGNAREYWKDRVERLGSLLDIPAQLDSGLIDQIEIHRRIVNNPYYDNINMGTENFVVACFQNFLFRYPTGVELENAKNMVNGFPGTLFFKAGSSKPDFIAIFFSSDDYFEGQVVNLYNQYLFRDPVTSEMAIHTANYASQRNYLELQKTILSSDEYFFN